MADPRPRTVHPAVKALVAGQALISLLWSFPRATDPAERTGSNVILWVSETVARNRPVSAYMYATGLWQYWDMFAPNPQRRDVWLDAVAVYPNGEQRSYRFPRQRDYEVFERYFRERMRKYIERGASRRYQYLWPHMARHAAHRLGGSPSYVELRRHWSIVPPPGQAPGPERAEAFFRWIPEGAR